MKKKDYPITRKSPTEVRQDFLDEIENLLDLNEEMGLDKNTSIKFQESIDKLMSMRYIFFYAEYCDKCLNQTPKFIREAYGLITNENDVRELIVRSAQSINN